VAKYAHSVGFFITSRHCVRDNLELCCTLKLVTGLFLCSFVSKTVVAFDPKALYNQPPSVGSEPTHRQLHA
jgi:hypothetical protein